MEFTVEKYPELKFREKKTSPIDLLAVASTIDFDSYARMRDVFKFALENMEVSTGENWVPVKAQDREVYMPAGLENDLVTMSELVKWYVENVLKRVFISSVE